MAEKVMGKFRKTARARIPMDEGELRRMHEMGAVQREIALCFDCDRRTVGTRLRKMGLGSNRTRERASNWKGGEYMDSHGYAIILKRNHQRATINGYVKRSIWMWELFNGIPFPQHKDPHHRDGDKLNDDPRNILPVTKEEHSRLGALLKADPNAAAKLERKLLEGIRKYIAERRRS